MRFPFDDAVMDELYDKILVVSFNDEINRTFRAETELSFNFDGSASPEGKWETCEGRLHVFDKDGMVRYVFDGAETRHGVVYAVGTAACEDLVSFKTKRIVLHEKREIGNDFNICISSHERYEAALQRMIESIRKSGFDMARVFAIVGGCKSDNLMEHDETLKVNVRRVRPSVHGVNALSHLPEDVSAHYWLLLHDTCEVDAEFAERIGKTDVGLNPDMVLFDEGERLDIGFYSKRVVVFEKETPSWIKPHENLPRLARSSDVVAILNPKCHKMTIEPPKDIYGQGVRRETLRMSSLGIRKYRAKAINGGKP